MSETLREFLRRNKWKILIVLLGVIITILIFTINFWRTLLLAAIVAVCYLIGTLMDQGGVQRVKEFFEHLLPKG